MRKETWEDIVNSPDDFTEHFRDAGFRESAIIGSDILNLVLKELVKKKLIWRITPTDLFEGKNAPIGSFAQRMDFALALGLLTKHEHRILGHIKSIRNTCAHRVTFRLPEVETQLEQLKQDFIKTLKKEVHAEAKRLYDVRDLDKAKALMVNVCFLMHLMILDRTTKTEKLIEIC